MKNGLGVSRGVAGRDDEEGRRDDVPDQEDGLQAALVAAEEDKEIDHEEDGDDDERDEAADQPHLDRELDAALSKRAFSRKLGAFRGVVACEKRNGLH